MVMIMIMLMIMIACTYIYYIHYKVCNRQVYNNLRKKEGLILISRFYR